MTKNVDSHIGTMKAWMIDEYNGPLLQREISIPQITASDQVLIKVKAASINPIDGRMITGYGDELLSRWRQFETSSWTKPQRLPLITGRDCCGEVVAVGSEVQNIVIGDQVIAVVPGPSPGSHAEYVVTKENAVAQKPKNVDYIEATTLPYVACTAWAALMSVARIDPKNAHGQCVLIHGGSGGMGSAAIQMLKYWGAEKVVATCSARNMEYVVDLGAIAIDYNDPDAKNKITNEGPFDVILDCANSDLANWSDNVMKNWHNSVHVSVISPILKDIDRYGSVLGLTATIFKYFQRSIYPAMNGRWFSYAFFKPNKECLEQISILIDNGQIKIPNIEKIYKFDEVPEAYKKIAEYHTKGKLVIDVAGEKN